MRCSWLDDSYQSNSAVDHRALLPLELSLAWSPFAKREV
jgi:hypothetical protein